MNYRNKIKKIIVFPLMKYWYMLKGVGTYFPDFLRLTLFPKHQNQFYNNGSIRESSVPASLSYSTWLRMLVRLNEKKIPISKIKSVVEFGSGDSLGIGMAAILAGSNKYYALDIQENAFSSDTLDIFDELVFMFKNRTSIPDDSKFPKSKIKLNSYKFPSHILTDEHLKKCLDKKRIQKIRNSLKSLLNKEKPRSKEVTMRYIVPWNDSSVLQKNSIDFIYSVAVMEHIDDFLDAYRAFGCWIKKNGIMAHNIGYNSHNTARLWNGHWTYSDFVWKIIRGRCHFLINRLPHSEHVKIIKKEKFSIITEDLFFSENILMRNDLCKKFRNITDGDLKISSSFIIAQKNG